MPAKLLAAATALGLLLSGCDNSTTQDTAEPVAPTPALVAVPTPSSQRLDELGAAQINALNARLAALTDAIPDDAAKRAELADAFGEAGLDYQAYGFDQAARASYSNAARLAPGDWRWPYLEAVIALDGGDSGHAEAGLQRATELHRAARRRLPPDDRSAHQQAIAIGWRLGEAALERGDSQTAVTRLRRVTELGPGAVAAWLSLGRAELARGRAKAALAALARADALAPDEPAIHYQQGLAYRALGDRERATALLAAATGGAATIGIRDPLLAGLALRKRSPAALLQRGSGLLDAGRYRQAAKMYRTALALDPDSSVAHVNLAACLIRLANPRQARRHLEQALALDPGLANAHIGLAGLEKRNGRPDAALAHLLAAESLTPGNAQMLADLGHLLAERGDADAAERRFDRLLEQQPNNERGLLGRARVLDLRGQTDAALEALVDAAERHPGSVAIERALASYRQRL